MIKKLFICFSFFSGVFGLQAQVKKRVVLEHFSNTESLECAEKNRTILGVLSEHREVIHLTFYPSNLSNKCYFYTQNPSEYDGRSHYNRVMKHAPGLVLNGRLLSDSAVENATFDTLENEFSPVAVYVKVQQITPDSFSIAAAMRAYDTIRVDLGRLFIGIVEDTVWHQTTNGEAYHVSVVRAALTPVRGTTLQTQWKPGDSITYYYGFKHFGSWNERRLKAVAILQRADTKEVWNAASKYLFGETLATKDLSRPSLHCFPNPVTETLHFDEKYPEKDLAIFNAQGLKMGAIPAKSATFHVGHLPVGIYFIESVGKIMVIR